MPLRLILYIDTALSINNERSIEFSLGAAQFYQSSRLHRGLFSRKSHTRTSNFHKRVARLRATRDSSCSRQAIGTLHRWNLRGVCACVWDNKAKVRLSFLSLSLSPFVMKQRITKGDHGSFLNEFLTADAFRSKLLLLLLLLLSYTHNEPRNNSKSVFFSD